MMRRLLLFSVTFLALFLVALTNPSPQSHEEQIVAQYSEQNPITGKLGAGHILAEMTTYHNYLLFSTTSFRDERISIGALGFIHTRSLTIDELPSTMIDHLPKGLRDQLKE